MDISNEIGFEANNLPLGTLSVNHSSINKSESTAVTITATLNAAAPEGGRSIWLDISGGHSSQEDYGVKKHYTLSGADIVGTPDNWEYNWTRVELDYDQGETEKTFTLTGYNNPVIERDRVITISGLGNVTITIVDDNRDETKGDNGVVDVTNATHLATLSEGLTALDKTGATDNRARLNAILAAIPVGGGVVLYFPDGTYKILSHLGSVSQIVFGDSSGKGISLIGQSKTGTVFNFGPNLAAPADTWWIGNNNLEGLYNNDNDSKPLSIVNFTMNHDNSVQGSELCSTINMQCDSVKAGRVVYRAEQLEINDGVNPFMLYNNIDYDIYEVTHNRSTGCTIRPIGGWCVGVATKFKELGTNGTIWRTRIDSENEAPGYDNGNGTYEVNYTYNDCTINECSINIAPQDSSTWVFNNLNMTYDTEVRSGTMMLIGGDGTGTITFNNGNLTGTNDYSDADNQHTEYGTITYNDCDIKLCKTSNSYDYVTFVRHYPRTLQTLTGQRLTFDGCHFSLTDDAKTLTERCVFEQAGSDDYTNDNRVEFTGCSLETGFTNFSKNGASGGYLIVDDMTLNTSGTTEALAAIKIQQALGYKFKLVMTDIVFTGQAFYSNPGNPTNNVLEFGSVTASNLPDEHIWRGPPSGDVCTLATGHSFMFRSSRGTAPTSAYNGMVGWECVANEVTYTCTTAGWGDYDPAVWE